MTVTLLYVDPPEPEDQEFVALVRREIAEADARARATAPVIDVENDGSRGKLGADAD